MRPNFNPSWLKLIVGLGNPGRSYENTYHNTGAMFVSQIKKSFPSNYHHDLLVSDSYMNQSGAYTAKAKRKSGARPEEILVIHDDSDLPLGSWKLDFDRGSGGHKGIASIIDALGTKKFWRLRIGIREANPPSLLLRQKLRKDTVKLRRARAEEFVLKKIGAAHKKTLVGVFREIRHEIFAEK